MTCDLTSNTGVGVFVWVVLISVQHAHETDLTVAK